MLSTRTALGAIWLFAGRFLNIGIGLASTIIMARLLMPADIGIVTLAMSVMVVASAAAELPVGAALIQLKDPTEDDFNTAFTLSVLRGLIIFVIMMALAWPVAYAFKNSLTAHPRELAYLIMAFALYPLVLGFQNANFEQWARELKFDREFLMSVTAKVVAFVVSVWMAYEFRNYWALVVQQLLLAGVSVLMTYILRPKLCGFSLKSFKRIFNFSVWLGLGWLVNQINWRSDNFVIGAELGEDTLGQYSMGSNLANESTQMAIQAILRSLYSGFSQIQADRGRLQAAYLKAQSMTLAFVLPIGLGLSILADVLVPILLGPNWHMAVIVVQVSAPIAAILTLTGPSQALGMALGRTRTIFFRDVFALVTRLPMLLIGIFTAGLIGVLVARAASGVVMLIVNLGMVRNFIGITLISQLVNTWRSLLSGALMMMGVVGARHWVKVEGEPLQQFFALGVLVGVGGVIYVGLHAVLWLISGRPEGPETKLLEMVEKVRTKLFPGTIADA